MNLIRFLYVQPVFPVSLLRVICLNFIRMFCVHSVYCKRSILILSILIGSAFLKEVNSFIKINIYTKETRNSRTCLSSESTIAFPH